MQCQHLLPVSRSSFVVRRALAFAMLPVAALAMGCSASGLGFLGTHAAPTEEEIAAAKWQVEQPLLARTTAVAYAAGYPPQELPDVAATALSRMGEPAIEPLMHALGDPDPLVRMNAARALGGMGSTAEVAIPALIQSLQDSNLEVRRTAAAALGQMGPAAAEAIPALIESLGAQPRSAGDENAPSLPPDLVIPDPVPGEQTPSASDAVPRA